MVAVQRWVTATRVKDETRYLRWLVPLAALALPVILAQLALVTAKTPITGDVWHNLITPRWDALNYLSIARHGYTVYTCPAGYKYAGKLCGTVGWYPGWPLVLAGIFALHLPISVALQAWLANLIFAYTGFALLYRLALRYVAPQHAAWGVLAAAALPGSFYYLTAFPYGLVLALSAGYALTYNEYPKRAALLAALLSLTYPQAAIYLFAPLASTWPIRRAALPGLALVTLPFALGPLALAGYFWQRFGNPWLYFSFQSRYGWRASLPFDLMRLDVHQSLGLVHASATLTILAMCGVALATFTPRLPRAYLVVGIVGLIGFLCLGTIRSIARYDLLLPNAVWLATTRFSGRRLFIVALAALAGFVVCRQYFTGTLI